MFAFLDRFRIYVTQEKQGSAIDEGLAKIIDQLLIQFVSICTKSIQYTKKRHRLKLVGKVFFFRDDDGVKDALSDLEQLVEQETKMSVALILKLANTEAKLNAEQRETVRSIDDKADQILSLQSRRDNVDKRKEAEETSKKTRDVIARALDIKEDGRLLFATESWKVPQQSYLRTQADETGTWLFEDDAFNAWSDIEGGQPCVMSCAGAEGYGKSHLCSAVIHYLASVFPVSREGRRVSVAYHYFPKGKKDEISVNKALRLMILQLAQWDPMYQRKLANICEGNVDFAERTSELWQKCVVELAPKTESTFFLIFDGIDEAETEKARPLTKIIADIITLPQIKEQLQIRVFLTGTPKSVHTIRAECGTPFPIISLGSCNQSDQRSYINMKMAQLGILTQRTEENQELRDLICAKLTNGAKGDFVKISYHLSDIQKCEERSEIHGVLDRAHEERQDVIERQIAKLNKSLTRRNIEDLNILLLWCWGCMDPGGAPIALLEDVMVAKTKGESLLSLEEQIQERYTALLQIDEYTRLVKLRSATVANVLADLWHVARSGSSAEQDALHEKEVAVVQYFISQVCDPLLYRKFGFDDFFEQKRAKKDASIQLERDTVDIKIVKTCLQSFCDDSEHADDLMELRRYATYFLPDHLAQMDTLTADRELKVEVGQLLVDLFYNSTYIGRFWNDDFGETMLRSWMWSDVYLDYVLRFLREPDVVRALVDFGDKKQDFVNSLTSSTGQPSDLLKPAAPLAAAMLVRGIDAHH